MTQYEIYTFILCLIVFIILIVLFSFLLSHIVKLTIRLIRCGDEDAAILKEYRESRNIPKKLRATNVLGSIFSLLVCIALFVTFVLSIYLNATETTAANGLPSLKIVKSSSMSYIDQKNDYLIQNNINNRLQTFDLIVTEKLPSEFDLKLYDIVVYESDGEMIIHRIVGIEEPNEKHPNERYFTLQGDAVQYADKVPVKYVQMRGVYRNIRIPFVGSFIMFMQSPAGWLCILLVLFALITTPMVEKKLAKEKEARLQVIGYRGLRSPLNRDKIPLSVSSPTVLSHFRLLLHIQKEDPKVTLHIFKTTGSTTITPNKGKG